jgi:DNA-3-methyladenine glycosylase II
MSSDTQDTTPLAAGPVPARAPKLPRSSPVLGGPEALKYLRRDPVLKRVIRQIGPCTLRPVKREPYEALVRAIAHQQVHGRAAEAILGRFIALYPGHDFPPAAQVLETPVEAMRGCGLSGSKVAAIRDIAEKAVGGLVPSRKVAARIGDEALIERLGAIRGVGRWTVEMLLIFTLGRRDVLPVDDFGVREGWRVATGAEEQVKPKELAAIGEAWAPWRSIAAWYLWRAADAAKASRFKPQ